MQLSVTFIIYRHRCQSVSNIQGWAKKLHHFELISSVYDDAERRFMYQNV